MNHPISRRSALVRLAGAGLAGRVAFAAPPDFATGPLNDWRKQVPRKWLAPAFEYLQRTDLKTLAVGRHEIDGHRMYITIAEATTRPLKNEKFETHRRYADVHYLISGAEVIGAARAADLKIATPYDAEKEAEMLDQPAEFRHIRLKPGNFAVFLPGQAHLPGCHENAPMQIRKAVVKVLAR